MKNIFHIFLFQACLLLFLNACQGDVDYPSGRDTVKSFASGRFQILRMAREPNIFHDGKEQTTILDDVIDWTKSGKHVFLTGRLNGKARYVIFDIENETNKIFSVSKDIPQEYLKQFKF